jgi:hypothetical protein
VPDVRHSEGRGRTVIVRRGDEVIGHVTLGDGNCENERCLIAINNGRPWHAIPMGFAVTLPDYHFASGTEAVMAIHNAMEGIPGRTLSLTVAQDTNWREGKY